MPGNIWVLAEHWRGKVSEITFEALALGRDVADQLGSKVEAVLLGHGVKDLASQLGAAARVISTDHEALAEVVPEVYAEALAQLARRERPAAVLTPLSNVTLGVGTLLAAKLGASAINFCKNVRVVDGKIEAHAVLYGGKIETKVAAAAEPVVLGIGPGARLADAGRSAEPPAVVDEVTVDLPEAQPIRFKEFIEPEAGEVDVTQQDVLVAVGRGIGSRDNIALAEELAAALGGVVCGSRPVIDQGWLPPSRQIGKSGMQVKPRLYLALGISGAPEHVEGMRGAELIVAVNTDPAAPIFNVAHYGTTADVLEFLPLLTEQAKALRG
ncbi:MAG: electron transfer flavoprotein subunit alpha/FixB family protein [Bryobacterales bacterium]|nr:electron transfer flavoprotein subunit alpha/FixB family protein [Bryobacterales bacterium]